MCWSDVSSPVPCTPEAWRVLHGGISQANAGHTTTLQRLSQQQGLQGGVQLCTNTLKQHRRAELHGVLQHPQHVTPTGGLDDLHKMHAGAAVHNMGIHRSLCCLPQAARQFCPQRNCAVCPHASSCSVVDTLQTCSLLSNPRMCVPYETSVVHSCC